MTGGPIRPDPTDRIKRFVSAQQFLAGVFMGVIAGTLIGAAAIITSFSTASVVLWSGVALSIMGGIVGASRFARSQPSRAQASA